MQASGGCHSWHMQPASLAGQGRSAGLCMAAPEQSQQKLMKRQGWRQMPHLGCGSAAIATFRLEPAVVGLAVLGRVWLLCGWYSCSGMSKTSSSSASSDTSSPCCITQAPDLVTLYERHLRPVDHVTCHPLAGQHQPIMLLFCCECTAVLFLCGLYSCSGL